MKPAATTCIYGTINCDRERKSGCAADRAVNSLKQRNPFANGSIFSDRAPNESVTEIEGVSLGKRHPLLHVAR
ncbi:MAG TPA: hypothetical protein VHM22_18125, partial [Bradyrhizobium sp.]|nr:hypothetical protein [Bradyrhizobium sp.]